MRGEEVFVENFIGAFRHLAGRPVSLYGTGKYTELLIKSAKVRREMNIIALIDPNLTGREVLSLPVMDISEAVRTTEAVIIVSNLSSAPLIYARIAGYFVRDVKTGIRGGCKVYFCNGEEPDLDEPDRSVPYWGMTPGKLLDEASRHDVISLDVFDTVLMRKFLEPAGVFRLVERRAGLGEDFSSERKAAEKYCSRNVSRYFTLDMIYEVLREKYGWSDEKRDALKRTELAAEKGVVTPRVVMADFARQISRGTKKVIFTSDMYLPKEVIAGFLEDAGCGGIPLYVSSDCEKNKYDGSMYESLKEAYPGEKILHVGDSIATDVNAARDHGVESIYTMSARDMLEASGLSDRVGFCHSTEENDLVFGLFAARYANDPFSLSVGKGARIIDDIYDVGYLFFGPLVLYYMAWLAERVVSLRLDRVLFLARDGFSWKTIYDELSAGVLPYLPESVYFYASRQALSMAAIESDEDIIFIVDEMLNVNSMRYEDILKNAFGIEEPDADDDNGDMTLLEIGRKALIEKLVGRYRSRIMSMAKDARRGYLAYIDSLGLPESGRLGISNFVGRGVSQRFIHSLFARRHGCELFGLYFASEFWMYDIYPEPEKIYAAFESGTSIHTSRMNVVKEILAGESVFTAPHGSVRHFTENGTPVFSNDESKRSLDILRCHEGIRQYVADFVKICGLPDCRRLDRDFIDRLYGVLFSRWVRLAPEVAGAFSFTDPYGGKYK